MPADPAGSESAVEPQELLDWYLPERKVAPPPGVRIEELAPRHSDDVNALFNLVFRRQRSRNDLDWKYWENPDGPAVGAVATNEQDGRLLLAFALIPHMFWVNGGEGLCYQAAETAVRPKARSGGVVLRSVYPTVVASGRDRGAILGYGGQSNEEAIKVGTRWLGYRVLFALHPWEKRLSLAPAIRSRMGAVGSSVGRAADRLLRPIAARRRTGFTGAIEPRDGFGPEFDETWEHLRDRYRVALRRSSAYLQWRFGRNPVARHRAIVARGREGPAGFAVWRKSSQDGVMRATLLDLLDGRDPAVAAALLDGAAREAARDGCEFLFFSAMPDGPAEAAMKTLSGFRPSDREPTDRVIAAPPRWAKPTARVLAQMMTLMDPRNWHYTQGDSDFRD